MVARSVAPYPLVLKLCVARQLRHNIPMRKLYSVFLVVLFCGVAWAQAETPAPVAVVPAIAPATATAPAPAPVAAVPLVVPEPLVLFSREVFAFRAPLLGVSAQARSKRAFTRIQEQLDQAGPHAVSVRTEALGVLVQIDGGTSFVISPADLDPASNDSLELVAQQAADALSRAIAESREGRDFKTLSRALLLALAVTAAYALLLWLLAQARQALARRLLLVSDKHSARLRVGGMALLHPERVAHGVQLFLTLVYRLVVLVLTVEWFSFVLRSFPFTRAWGESLNGYLIGLAMPLWEASVRAVPELLTALLIFYVVFLLTKGMDRFFANVQLGRIQLSWLGPDTVVPTQRLSKVAVWLFGVAMAYPYLPGSDTEAFKGLSVLVGLMLSMGASSLVGQAASGLILTYGRAFRKGEFVCVADHEGTVTEMGVFTTRIRTGLGEELTISNASILASTTKNYSRAVQGPGFVLDTTVTIGYDTPWRQVHALLVEAAKRTPGVLQEPAPQVFQTALSDWYPEYRLVCQAIPEEPRPRARLLSDLHASIQDVFNEYGVQILSPNYIADPHEAKVVPPEKWYAAPAQRPD
jgi:small-conductance mechanosensitive channel